jgi:hypothetical protein
VIGPDDFSGVSAAAAVPEQLVAYVTAVTDARPCMVGSCVGYRSGDDFVLVGYPMHDPADERAMAEAVEKALEITGPSRIIVMGPVRPPQAPGSSTVSEDYYSLLPVPPPPPGQKLRNMLRRAGRELAVEKNRHWEEEHTALVRRYLEERSFDPGTEHIFRNIPRYLAASSGSLIFSARRGSRLAAFAVGEFASFSTAFFMFCFRDPAEAPPGSTDLLLSALLDEAGARGHMRMNLGLQINEGIRSFKRKWGEGAKIPYVQVSWDISRPGFSARLRALFSKNSKGDGCEKR